MISRRYASRIAARNENLSIHVDSVEVSGRNSLNENYRMKCRRSQHIKVCDDNKDEENNPAVNIINNDKSLPQKSRQKLYI